MKFSSNLFFSIVLLFSFQANAQKDFLKNSSISAHYQRGFAIPEYSFINYLTNDYAQSITLDFAKQTTGKNEWEHLYKFPEYGFSLFYTSLGNDAVLGKALAANYFFKVNFISTEKWKIFNQTGIGLGYITKKFHLEDNYKNVGIGSNFNVHFNSRVGMSYQITENWKANAGLAFDHFSNGNTADPNLGLNNATLFAGLQFAPGEIEKKNKTKLSAHERKNNFEAVLSVGAKQTRALSSKFFYTSSLTGGINREFFRGVHLGIGADVFFDQSIKTQMESRGETFSQPDDFQTGLHISQEFVYNRFSLILQEGIYLGLINKGLKKTMFNRGIVQFQLNDRFLLRIAMKSHLHILDFPELGFGIKW